MLKNNYYTDEHMYFTFNYIRSDKYNLFIVNDGDSLKIINNPGASTTYSSPMYQNSAYLLGTNKTQKTISYKCAAEKLTLLQYKEMMKWLNIGDTGFLVVDSNPYWGYDVVLETVSDAIIHYSDELMIVEFDISFKTIGDWCAKALLNSYASIGNKAFDAKEDLPKPLDPLDSFIKTRLEQTSINEYGIPEINFASIDADNIKTIYIQSVSNEHSYIDYNYTLAPNALSNSYPFIIKENTIPYINYSLNNPARDTDISYLGEYGFVLTNNSQLVENSDLVTASIQNNGLLVMENESPKKVEVISITEVDTNLMIEIDVDSYNYLQLNNGYLCISYNTEYDGLQYNKYNLDKYNQDTKINSNNLYSFQYYNMLFYTKDIKFKSINNKFYITVQYDSMQRKLTLSQIQKSNIYIGKYYTITIDDGNATSSSLTVIKHNNL